MNLKIIRLSSDERFYFIVYDWGSRSGMRASHLKTFLLDIGIEDSTIAAVLNMSPNETMSIY
jgi:hypothetical protein